MKRFLNLLAISLVLFTTASAFQGGGGEPTKKKAIPKRTSVTKPNNTTPPRPPAPPARPATPTVASVIVNSNLPNVTVTINGRTAGTTDSNGYLAIGSMKPGAYTVSTAKPGYQPANTVVTLSGGQNETLNFELKPITQALTISSTPAECEVYVDEILRGRTDASGNIRLADLPVGEHRIAVRKRRYKETVLPLLLSPDREGQINANLELAVGFLTVTTNAPNPSIDISGLGHFANSLSKFECQPGTYIITIASPLYVTSRKEVSVSAGQEAQLSVDLEADTEARSRLTSEALAAYSSKQYDQAINVVKTLVAIDSKHAQALTVLAQSYFMKDDFESFVKFGSEAIEAGGSVEILLNHQFSAYNLMHPVRLVLTAQTLTYDPQPAQNMVCEYPAFKVSLAVLSAAEVGGNRANEIHLRLVFLGSNKPKKPTTLRFRDRGSYFVEKGKSTAGGLVGYIGFTVVSPPRESEAMTAIAALLNIAKSKMNRIAGNPNPRALEMNAANTKANPTTTNKAQEVALGAGSSESVKGSTAAPTSMPTPTNQAGIEFVFIPAGEFMMGEYPAHRVAISRPFYLGKYEVTQGQWQSVMGNNPSHFQACDDCPVEQVSWDDAQKFIKRLNATQGQYIFRLPTEAEWEYAARAGTTGDDVHNIDSLAWYGDNSGNSRIDVDKLWRDDQNNFVQRLKENGNKTHPVGTKQPNAWGLYDMLGNVEEWCQDWYANDTTSTAVDPLGPAKGKYRVVRGSSWYAFAAGTRSAFRSGLLPDARFDRYGFRVVAVARTP